MTVEGFPLKLTWQNQLKRFPIAFVLSKSDIAHKNVFFIIMRSCVINII